MGVGTPDDLLQALSRGVDMFDCVMPTRAGRHGLVYTRYGQMTLKNARFADDPRPIDESSTAPAARMFSRAYLHHLVKSDEILGMMALTAVNLAYYQDLMAGARAAIARRGIAEFVAETREGWERGEIPGA
jgi:queuine tRNA-ribosyltransferase